jgi:hypothetical protein
MRRAFVIACSIFAVFMVVSYLLLFEPDVTSESYSTFGEAEQAGLFRRGWLPSYIPRSAASIAETHDLDTNERCASFSIAASDRDTFVAMLTDRGFRRASASISSPPELSPLRSCSFSVAPAEAVIVMRRPDPDSAEVEYFALFDPPDRVYFWNGLR